MTKNKASKKGSSKGKGTSKKITPKKAKAVSKKTQPSTSKKVVPSVNRFGKRKAVRKPARKYSNYNLIQGAIADYCVRKYGRKCSKKEISEIYQGLKSRYLEEGRKSPFTPQEIAKAIDKRLAYLGKDAMPTLLKDFEWFQVVAILVFNDGGFFKPADRLVFDLTSIGLGKRRTEFSDLADFYKEELYVEIREWMMDVEVETGIKMSPPPTFVLDEDASDMQKRIYVWKLDFGEVEGAEEVVDTEGAKEKGVEEVVVEEKEAPSEEKGKEKGVSEKVLLEREKTAQMREKTKQEAMALLKEGKIDLETFKMLIQ